jgi:hypothetical protein
MHRILPQEKKTHYLMSYSVPALGWHLYMYSSWSLGSLAVSKTVGKEKLGKVKV